MSFAGDIEKFKRKYESRLRATARDSVQETLSIAQRVRDDGGRMRIQFGFLRGSIQGAIGHMPSGPSDNKEKKTYAMDAQIAGEPISVVLLKWDPVKGETFYAGWTANYARHREAHDGFLRGAVELWDETVRKSAAKVNQQIG